jgi:hypothetical protein
MPNNKLLYKCLCALKLVSASVENTILTFIFQISQGVNGVFSNEMIQEKSIPKGTLAEADDPTNSVILYQCVVLLAYIRVCINHNELA